MTVRWLWDWRVSIWIGIVDGWPLIDVSWEQRTPPPWRKP